MTGLFDQIETTFRTLAKQRPVFHSEADLQHELGLRLRQTLPDCQIRLEKPAVFRGSRASIDMVIRHDGLECFVEIKYKTAKYSGNWSDEEFLLKNHGAKDLGSYDVIKDVCRVETFVKATPGSCGCVVFLTNDPAYWSDTRAKGTIDVDFQLVEGRCLNGTLKWANHAGAGSIKGREQPLSLHHSHQLSWQSYSNIGATGPSQFRYLFFKVPLGDVPVCESAPATVSHSKDSRTPTSKLRRDASEHIREPIPDTGSTPHSQREAVLRSIKAFGGTAKPQQVADYAKKTWGLDIKACGTVMADMVHPSHGGNTSSTVPLPFRKLKKTGRGEYSLL